MPTNTEYHDPYDDGNEDPDDPRNFGDRWKRADAPEGPQKPEQGSPARPEHGGLPIPPDALKWYPTALYRWLTTAVWDGGSGQKTGEWIAKYVRWYQERIADFLLYERYGEGLSMWGGWRLNEMAMWDALPRADTDLGWTEPVEATEPPEPRVPVEPATEADIDAALTRMETERQLPDEPYASSVLRRSLGNHDPQIDRWMETRDRIKAKTPIPCRCCGAFFLVPNCQHFANCPDCRAAGRKRCLDCTEVFTPVHNKIKRCDSCLAREAEWKANRKRH